MGSTQELAKPLGLERFQSEGDAGSRLVSFFQPTRLAQRCLGFHRQFDGLNPKQHSNAAFELVF